MPIRPHLSKVIAGTPFFLGAWIFGFFNDRWYVATYEAAKKSSLPDPTELYRDYFCDQGLPFAIAVLLLTAPISWRSRTAIFVSYVLLSAACIAMPYAMMGVIVDGGEKTLGLAIPKVLLGIAGGIIVVRVVRHFRKQKKNTET